MTKINDDLIVIIGGTGSKTTLLVDVAKNFSMTYGPELHFKSVADHLKFLLKKSRFIYLYRKVR